MPIYMVFFVTDSYLGRYQIKTVRKVVRTTLDRMDIELKKNSELLSAVNYPYVQWEIVNRPDNSHLEELANNA